MSIRNLLSPLVLALFAGGCDPAAGGSTDSRRRQDASALQLVAAERDHSITYLAFASVDASPDQGSCAAIVIGDADPAVIVAGPRDVVAVCDPGEPECTLEVAADDLQSCGLAPDVIADHAVEVAERDELRLGQYCPPWEQSCEPGGGYSCIDPACKSACGKDARACNAGCDGDWSCTEACADEAQACFSGCC